MSFFEELKRRTVLRVGVAYAVAASMLLQIFDVVGEILELPACGGGLILVALILGFLLALFFAWAEPRCWRTTSATTRLKRPTARPSN